TVVTSGSRATLRESGHIQGSRMKRSSDNTRKKAELNESTSSDEATAQTIKPTYKAVEFRPASLVWWRNCLRTRKAMAVASNTISAQATIEIRRLKRLWSRSEEHTSEPSHDQISYAVFCLKKKKEKKKRKEKTKKNKEKKKNTLNT